MLFPRTGFREPGFQYGWFQKPGFSKTRISGNVSEKSVFQKLVSKKWFQIADFHSMIFAWLIPDVCRLALGL
jgi:hypothetical protein